MLEQRVCGLATASGTRSRPKMSCCSCPARRSTRRRSKAPCSNGAKLVVIRDTEDIAGDAAAWKRCCVGSRCRFFGPRAACSIIYLSNPDLCRAALSAGGRGGADRHADAAHGAAAPPSTRVNGYPPNAPRSPRYAIAQDEARSSIPIGRAIPGRELYVLDRWRQPLPAWLALYIGGSALARGYLNQPQQTRGEFHRVARPAPIQNRRRVLAARRNLEYLGRNDCGENSRIQVELSEIENAINAPEGVERRSGGCRPSGARRPPIC